MPYRYLEDIAIADVAFEAWGQTPEEMLLAASDAAVNVMVSNLDSIVVREYRGFQVEDEQIDMLLFQILQELIFFKDAEKLLLRVQAIQLRQHEEGWIAIVQGGGEYIDSERHDLLVDVKAVTLHRLQVKKTASAWSATVVLDV